MTSMFHDPDMKAGEATATNWKRSADEKPRTQREKSDESERKSLFARLFSKK